jgi:hypothetical protein
MGSVLHQVNHDNSIADLSAIPSLGAKAGVSYMAENGADVSVFDAYQGHLVFERRPSPRPISGRGHAMREQPQGG